MPTFVRTMSTTNLATGITITLSVGETRQTSYTNGQLLKQRLHLLEEVV